MNIIKNWKFWVAIVAVVLIIACVILWFTNRTFCYATSGLVIGLLVGFIVGYFVGKKYGNQQ
ncbi:MAG: hypothetical protein IKN59_01800 [Paludibacteraceae bacterium]|nr:hypothetical protein [Paludibacteraceae bacterium]